MIAHLEEEKAALQAAEAKQQAAEANLIEEKAARKVANGRQGGDGSILWNCFRLAAAGRLRSAVALELSPGLMWAAGRLGPRDIGDGLRSPQ